MDLYKEPITHEALQAIRDRVFPGCVVGVVRSDGSREIYPFGHFTYEETSPAVDADTMYDTASITKSIPTASLALQLIQDGRLALTDRLIDYIPEFKNSDREKVLIKHLLTYTLDGYGLAARRLEAGTAAGLLELLMTRDFENPPGTVFKYTNIPAALLGLVIEKIYGTTLDVAADEHFFLPLRMTRTTFFPERFSPDTIPPTERDEWRGLVQGVVHDESAYLCKKDGKITGHAGLFSTAPDLLTFLEMLLHRGTFRGVQYFSESIIEQIQTNQIPELGDFTGLGWELNQPRYMGHYCSPHTFGKTGFTGTLCVCDIGKGIGYVILSNRTFPVRPADSGAINGFRKKIGEILLKA